MISHLKTKENSVSPAKLRLNLEDMEALAQQLAVILEAGDTLTLKGDLGAGKTSFARALIRALTGESQLEVPSPTFSLCIPYKAKRFTISHFDLYRLSGPDELEELGFYETIERDITLIEWPERLGGQILNNHLGLEFEETEDGQSRLVSFHSCGTITPRLDRFFKIQTFLATAGWDKASWDVLQGDASTRSYLRLTKTGQTALLMNAPPQPDGPPIKDNKPYSQIAHLAEDMTSFVAIATALRAKGFSLPEIIHHDIKTGLLLISDLGDEQYHHLITIENQPKAPLYQNAIDVLTELRAHKPTPMSVGEVSYTLPTYDQTALAIETDLLSEWYWPYVKGETCPLSAKSDYDQIWQDLIQTLCHEEYDHWVLRDYHSPNLMALEGKTALERVGIIDFQDALKGHAAYDVVSLCQDARLTITAPEEQALLQRYLTNTQAKEASFQTEKFLSCYAILGAQRCCKLLGIFVRLSKRDGKHHYLAHIPRIWDYLERNLEHRALAHLNKWFATHFSGEERANFFTSKSQS